MEIVDLGFDKNFDGHCDICGRFVDRYGHHRARMVFDRDTLESFDPAYLDLDVEYESVDTRVFVDKHFKGRPYDTYKNSSYIYWPLIKKYTEDDPDDPYGRKAINDMLRFDRVPDKVNPFDILQIVFKMNAAIDRFEVNKAFVVFRGMHFANRDNQFVKMLDEAYDSLKGERPYPFFDKGFVSTSRRIEYAARFSKGQNDCVQVLLAYIIQPGAKAMPLSGEASTTAKEYEKEVLLKAGEKYFLTGLERYRVDNKFVYKGIVVVSKEELD